MGSCTASAHISQRSDSVSAFYDGILKCPASHWLACYETPRCSICHSKRINRSAHISCTQCSYSICEDCYARRFQKWCYNVRHLQCEDARHFLIMMQEEIEEFLGNSCLKSKSSHRLCQFLEQEALKNSQLRAEWQPTSVDLSLEVRISKLVKRCEQIYKEQLYTYK